MFFWTGYPSVYQSAPPYHHPGSLRVVSRDIALGLREPSASLLVRRSSNDVFGRVRVSIFWTVLLFLSLLRFLFILFVHSLSLKKYSVSRTQSEAFPSVFKILAHSLFFQQGRVALGKWCIGPQKGHHRTPGMDFFCTVPGPHFLVARWSGLAASASIFSVCLDYIPRVCQSLWDSFLYLQKLHWFLYLLLSYFYDSGMFIFRWSSNFVEKVVLNESMWAKMASRVSYLVYCYCI